MFTIVPKRLEITVTNLSTELSDGVGTSWRMKMTLELRKFSVEMGSLSLLKYRKSAKSSMTLSILNTTKFVLNHLMRWGNSAITELKL